MLEDKASKYFLGTVIVLAIIIWSVWGWYIPGLKHQQRELSVVFAQQQESLDTANEFQQEHGNVAAYQKELEKKIKFQEQRLPVKLESAALMGEIQQLSSVHGLSLVSLMPEKEEHAKEYSSVPVKVTMQGNYFSFLDFFKALGDSKLFIHVDSVELVSKAEARGGLECNLLLRIYSRS